MIDAGEERILAVSWEQRRGLYVLQMTNEAECHDMSGSLTRGPICLDELVTVEAVYDPLNRWNGFLKPRMDRDAVETVMAALGEYDEATEPKPPTRRWEGEMLILTEYDGDEEYSEALLPDADGRYALGAGSWVWSEDNHA